MGNRHDQHTSVIGFKKRPTHLAWTGRENMAKNTKMEHIVTHLFNSDTPMICPASIMIAGWRQIRLPVLGCVKHDVWSPFIS
jgi:hypothetical protein